ncbi:MAG: von Willebrand factor type domain [Pseudomonadota bacterium]|jgi:uncharacterized protein YegL
MDQPSLVAAAYKTVETFAGLVQRPLKLRNGKTPQTDGTHIQAPFKHPSLYCMVEHELSHVLFQSDLDGKRRFADEFPEPLQPLAAKLYNLLEDERVNSLWGELYPGSLAEMQALGLRTMLRHRPRAHDDLVTFALCIHARVPRMPVGPLSPFAPIVERALAEVRLGSPASTLIAARRLLGDLSLAWGFCDLPPPDLEATARAENTAAHQRLDDLEMPHVASDTPSAATARALGAAAAVEGADEASVRAALEASRQEARTWLDEVRRRLQQAGQRTQDGWMLRDVRDLVVLKDIPAGELPRPPRLAPEDALAAARLSQVLRRVRARRTQRLSDSGLAVDLEAALQRQVAGAAGPVFREEVTGRGLRALLLVDRSSSMAGEPTAEVERAARILRHALTQPGLSLETWGFRSRGKAAYLERVPEGSDLVTCAALPLHGQTPLHIALGAAANRLREQAEVSHLFVLTDGKPVFTPTRLRTGTDTLQAQVRDAVQSARRHGVGVSCLVVGDDLPDADAFEMFGPRRHWARTGTDALAGTLIRWVTSALVHSLRTS